MEKTWEWILQGLFSQALWEALLILGLGVLLTYLRNEMPKWGSFLQNAVFSIAALSLIFFSFTGRAVLSNPPVTPDNIGENVRAWTDDAQLTVQKVNESSYKAAYKITFSNGNAIEVSQPLDRLKYLYLRSGLIPDSDLSARIAKLTPQQLFSLKSKMALELARADVEFELDLTHIRLRKTIPVTESMTEDYFLQEIQSMNNAELIARLSLDQSLQSITQQ